MESILLNPLYCPRCGKLTLRHPEGLIDYTADGFTEHPCRVFKNKNILDNHDIAKIPQPIAGELLPFRPQRLAGIKAKAKKYSGLLVLEPFEDGLLKGITMENRLIDVKPLFDGSEVIPGQILDISKAHRLAPTKFRLEKNTTITVPINLDGLFKAPEEYYQIFFSSEDQRALDKGVSSFLSVSLAEGIQPYCITIEPIEKNRSATIYTRRMDLDPSAKLMATLQTNPTPPQVSLSIKHATR
ncbi:MAG: hypothetical protein QNL04_05190 [SAR324 cluster bacterium]|nr:hypothetical protein [SAR324 cluster bacterium]